MTVEILGAGACAGDQSTSHVCVKLDLGGESKGREPPPLPQGAAPDGYKYKH